MVALPLYEPQSDHGIGEYAERATRDAQTSCHVVQGGGSVR